MIDVRGLTPLQALVVEARAEVREAEAAYAHCPSGPNREYLETAWLRLDKLLDRLPRQREATC